jgi:acetolactate synthase small subunit
VLSRVSGILAGRGFNIDSLVVCRTEIRDLSRMCIVLRGQEGVVEQARRQLEDLVPVWAVLDYTDTPKIQRELLLVKVSLLGPEYLEDQLVGGPHHDPRLTAQQAAAAHAQAQYEAQDSQSVEASTQEEPHVSTGAASHDGTMPSVLEQTMAEGQAGTDAGHATEIHQSTQANVSLSTPTPSSGMTTAPDPANSEPQPLYNPHTPPGQQVQDIQQTYQAHQTYTHAAAEAEGYPSGPLSPQSHGPQPTPLTPSQALQLRAQHMHAISVLSAQFGAKMVDVSENSAIVELAAKTQRVDAFLRLLSPYGILESARSGMMTLPRTPLKPSAEEDEMGMDGAGVDMSMLPPG